ncbi:O-acetyl-ADP-ribose deacetylase [Candidatus Bathyarchaeota archaeon]|nr:O-acetyl-ADP-ribose deacetylase [Candidatus Bathyarchaeota archaeon]
MKVEGTEIKIILGDIVNQKTDAIVNAANSSLMGGGGVDGAIHRAGGPQILEECLEIRENQYTKGLPTGEAVLTTGGKLEAGYVIHTVGPIWEEGSKGEDDKLSEAYVNCLKLAERNGIKSISFPSISTGAYGYPIEKASEVAVKTVIEYLRENWVFSEVRFVLFNDYDYGIYNEVLSKFVTEAY